MLSRLKQSLFAKQRNRVQCVARKVQQVRRKLVFEPLENRYLLSAEFFIPPDDIQELAAEPVDFSTLDESLLAAVIEPDTGPGDGSVVDEGVEKTLTTDDGADATATEPGAENVFAAESVQDETLPPENPVLLSGGDVSLISDYVGIQLVIIDPTVPDYESLLEKLQAQGAAEVPADVKTDAGNADATVNQPPNPEPVASNETASRDEFAVLSGDAADLLASPVVNESSLNNTDIRYIVLDAEGDGIQQISDILAQYQNVGAVHLFSHGSSGFLRLGNSQLTSSRLDDYRDQLNDWGDSLSASADILLYGCNVADGETGIEFINKLAAFTGADVAASTDKTGNTALGGDWELETNTGVIEAATLAAADYRYLLEVVSATTGNDALMATQDGAADDFIFSDITWGGVDTVTGSADIDTLDLSSVSTALNITFNAGNRIVVDDGMGNTITTTGVEKVIGGSGADNYIFNDGWGVVTLQDTSFDNNANFDAVTNGPLTMATNADATVSMMEETNLLTLDFGQGDVLSAVTDISSWENFLIGDTVTGDTQQGGLTEFTRWAQSLGNFEEFTADLPAFGLTLEDVLDMANTIGQLETAVSDYYATSSTPSTPPTAQGLMNYLGTWAANTTYDGEPGTGLNGFGAATVFTSLSVETLFAADGSSELRFNFNYSAERITTFDLDFGRQAQELGIELAANAQVDLTASLDLEGSFAIGFTNTDAQYDPYFFLDITRFTAAANVAASDLQFAVDVGFLQAEINPDALNQDAMLVLDAMLVMDFSAGAGADGLTLTELQTTPLASLVDVTPDGTSGFSATLPLSISAAGFAPADLAAFSGAMLVVQANDVFSGDAPTVTVSNPDVLNFANLGEDDLLGMLDQLADWLIGVSSDELLNQEIPFTDSVTLGDALRFGQSFQDNVLAALRDYDGFSLADAANNISLNEDFDFNLEVVLDDGAGNLSRELLQVQIATNAFADGASFVVAINASIDQAITDLELAGLVAGDIQAVLQTNRIVFRPTAQGADNNISNIRLPTDRALDFAIEGMDFGGLVAGYQTAQEMADLLNTVLGSATGLPLQASYDASTGELSYTINYAPSLILGDVPVDFSMDLGDFAGIETSATLGLVANLDMGMTFGVDLSPTTDLVVAPPLLPNTVPGNGQLSADATFQVSVFQQEASVIDPITSIVMNGPYTSIAVFDVTVVADNTNSTVDDLLADVQAALDAQLTGIGLAVGAVYAEYTGERIVLVARPVTVDNADGIPEVRGQRVEVGAASTAQDDSYFYDNPALSELGLLTSPIPYDGVLGADINFTLDVEGLTLNAVSVSSITVALSAAATTDNTRVADLVADINAAIAADLNAQAGITTTSAANSPVQAFQIGANDLGEALGNRLGFMAIDGNGITALSIPATGNVSDPAVKLLGLDPEIDSVSRTPAVELFIDNAYFNGEVVLSAEDITAEARFGFMNIEVVDSSGSVSGNVGLNLQNASGESRVTLQEMFTGLAMASGVSSLFDASVSGDVDIDLAILPDVGLSGINLQPATLSLDLNIADWLNNPPDLLSAEFRDAQNTLDENASNNILVSVNGLDAPVFDNLRNLSLSDVIHGLNQVLGFLRDTQGVGDSDAFVSVLDTELPLLNASVSDILNTAGRFAVVVEELQASPANSLQMLEGVLKEILGLPVDSDLVSLTLDDTGGTLAVRLDLVFETGIELSRALDLNLTDLISLAGDVPGLNGISSLVGVSASGDLSVDVNGRLSISMGLDMGGSSASAEVLGFADGDNARGSATGVGAQLNAGGEVSYERLMADPVVIMLTVGDGLNTPVEVTIDTTGVVNALPTDSPALVSGATSLVELNSGNGVSAVAGNDLGIRLHDGSTVFVDLSTASTIDDVLTAITAADTDISATFNTTEQRIEVVDASTAAATSNPWVANGNSLVATAPAAGGESGSGFIVPFVVNEGAALSFTLQVGTRDSPVSVSVADAGGSSRAVWVADVEEQVRLAMLAAGQLDVAATATVDATYVAGKLVFAGTGVLAGKPLTINMGASPELEFYLQTGEDNAIVNVYVDSTSYTGVLSDNGQQTSSGNPVFLREVLTTDALDFTLRVGTGALPVSISLVSGWDVAAVNAAVMNALANAGQASATISSTYINGNLAVSADRDGTGQTLTLTTGSSTVTEQWLADIEDAVRQAMVEAGELDANDTATVSVSYRDGVLQFTHDDGVTLYQYDAGAGAIDGGGMLVVEAVNGSLAANDLGILTETTDRILQGDVLRVDALDDALIDKINADLDAALGAGVIVASRGADTGNPETFQLVLSGGVVDVANSGFIQIDSVRTSPQPFLYDTDDNDTPMIFNDDTGTQLFFGVGLRGENLEFTAQLGPFGMWVREGDASLTGNFSINVLDNNGDGRHYFLQSNDRIGLDDFDWQVTGSAETRLPLYFPTEDRPVADVSIDPTANNMVISIGDLAAYFEGKASGTTGSVIFSTPDLTTFAPPTLIGMLSNPEFLIDGLDVLLLSLQDSLDEMMDLNLPVIGGQLPGATSMIGDFREDILSYLSIQLRQGGLNPVTLVQETLYNVFGSENDGLLSDLTVLGFADGDQAFGQIVSGALADASGDLTGGAFDARFNLSVDGDISVITLAAADFGEGTLTGLVTALNASINARGLGAKVVAFATNDGVGFQALGSEQANTSVRVDTAGAIALNLGSLQFGTLGLLQDSARDADAIVDINDIFKTGFGTFDEYGQFDLSIGDTYIFGQSLDFDIGIPQLELDLDAGVELELDWGMNFGFGVDQTDGFYFATLSELNSETGPVDLGPEMYVTATARLLGVLGFAPGSDASGNENNSEAVLRGSGELPDSLSQNMTFQLQIGSTGTPTDIILSAGATPDKIVTAINNAFSGVASLDGNTLVLTDPGSASEFGYVQIIDAANARGQLGFLMLNAQDIPDSSTGDRAGEYSEVVLSASIDITDPDNDGKLTFSELVAESTTTDDMMTATFAGNAYLNLGVLVAFDVPGLENVALLPEIVFDLNLDWVDFANFSSVQTNAPDVGNESRLGGELSVDFENIQLDLGSFISDFVGPYLNGLSDVLEPLGFLLDRDSGLLYQRLPVISDLAGQTYTFLDLAELFGDLRVTNFLNAVEELYYFIGLVDDAVADANNQSIMLDFGSLSLGDLREVGSTSEINLDEASTAAGSSPTDQINSSSQGGAAIDFASNLTGPDRGSFAFPIIEDPGNIFNLLLGNAAGIDLVTYDLPPFGLDFDYRQRFPVFPPLFATLRGSMGITIDLGFGYDTTGLIQFSNSNNPIDLINGFFVSDVDFDTGEDISELTLSGRISAGASLDAVVASAGVEGGIAANIFLNLNDPNFDGKVRMGEMEANLQLNGYNPVAIFDPGGNINFVLEAYVEVLFGLWGKSMEIADVTLAEFEYNFTRPPVLASVSDGELLLNVGTSSAARYHGDIRDGDESIYARSQDGSVYVWGMGLSESQAQRYEGVDRIVAYGGEGNDTIDLSRVNSNVATEIYGGVGNDTLTGGAGLNVLYGGEGRDTLTGGAGADVLYGEEGADTLRGGAGADDLQGGGGNDNLAGGAGQDILQGGSDDDVLDGGADDDIFVMDNAWGVDTVIEAQASGSAGDVIDFSAVRTDIQIQLGDVDGNGSYITAQALDNSLLHTGFGIENILGGRGADLFEIYETGDNTIELNGQGGSDTYIAYAVADSAVMNIALHDVGDLWNIDKAVFFGTDSADNIVVDQAAVTAVTANATSSFAYGAFGVDSGIETLAVFARAGNDAINVDSTPETTAVLINGDEDDDTIVVGSVTAGVDNILGSDISGPIVIHGNDGSNALIINDMEDASNNTGILTGQIIRGLDMGTYIRYSDMDELSVYLGSGDDEFTIARTIIGTTALAGGAGNDVLNVESILGITSVAGDAGVDVINVGIEASQRGIDDVVNSGTYDAPGLVRIQSVAHGLADGDEITISDVQGMESVNGTFTVIVVDADTFDLVDTRFSVSDEYVQSTGAFVDPAADPSLKRITTIESVLTVSGGDDADDIVNIIDTAATEDVTVLLTASTITTSDMPGQINYDNSVEILNLQTGFGDDTLNTVSTSAGVHAYLWSNSGDDVFTVSSDAPGLDGALNGTLNGTLDDIQGEITVLAGDGLNGLYVSDRADPDADTGVVITENRITGLAPAPINYFTSGSFESGIRIWSGSGDDVISVQGALQDNVTAIWSNAGNDSVTLTDMSAAAEGIVAVFGQGGRDVLDARAWNAPTLLFGDDGDWTYIEGLAPAENLENLQDFFTTNPGQGDSDVLYGGTGSDVLTGGAGSDALFGNDGDDLLSGDGGTVSYRDGVLYQFQTSSHFIGGDDWLDGGQGNDVMFGGFGRDTFVGNLSEDVMVGEYSRLTMSNGTSDFVIRLGQGGQDLIATTMFDLYNKEPAAAPVPLFVPDEPGNDEIRSDESLAAPGTVQVSPLMNDRPVSHASGTPPPLPEKTEEEKETEQQKTPVVEATLPVLPPPELPISLPAPLKIDQPEGEKVECITTEGKLLNMESLWARFRSADSFREVINTIDDMIHVAAGEEKRTPGSTECTPLPANQKNIDDQSGIDTDDTGLLAGVVGMAGWQVMQHSRQAPEKQAVGTRVWKQESMQALQEAAKEKRFRRWRDGQFTPAQKSQR